MHFEESFFEGEYRHGFYVSEMMKRNWAAQMEVLEEIKKVCQKYKIRYFADWGTLLGAVRHHGFVPWDDDMDIGMTREDFQRFLAVAQEELPEGFKVFSLHNDHGYGYDDILIRVVNSTDINYSEEHLQKFHGCPYVIGLDIFPTDYVPRDPEEWEFQKAMIMAVVPTANHVKAGTIGEEDLKEILDAIRELSGVQIDETDNPRRQLMLLAEAFCAMYTEQDADMVASMTDLAQGSHKSWSKHVYDTMLEVPFETTTIAIPGGYDEVLRAKYGDYMRMRRGWGTHNYPYYRSQEEVLRKRFEEIGKSMPPVLQKALGATARYMNRSIPVEISDFKTIREKDFYYVDKTSILKECLEEKHKFWYIMKPERFGKSLFYNIIAYFRTVVFDAAGSSLTVRSLFEGLEVGDDFTHVQDYMGVGFGFRTFLMDSFEETFERIRMTLTFTYNNLASALYTEETTKEEAAFYDKIRSDDAEESDYAMALRMLAHGLSKAYQKKVFVILEDFDALLAHAYLHGFYDKMLALVQAMIRNTIMDNEELAGAFLLGRYEIETDRILEGIDKEQIGYISQFDDHYEEYFGYTDDEVDRLFRFYQMEDMRDMAREWFGGYGRKQQLYNPWSINNFVASVCNGADRPFTYWTEASTDVMRQKLLQKFAPLMKEEIRKLLDGGTLEKKLHREICFDDLHRDVEEIWNYLFLTGCLVAEEICEREGEQYGSLKIPNDECRKLLEDLL